MGGPALLWLRPCHHLFSSSPVQAKSKFCTSLMSLLCLCVLSPLLLMNILSGIKKKKRSFFIFLFFYFANPPKIFRFTNSLLNWHINRNQSFSYRRRANCLRTAYAHAKTSMWCLLMHWALAKKKSLSIFKYDFLIFLKKLFKVYFWL